MRQTGGGAARQTGGGAARQTGGGAARQTGGGAARQTGGGAERQTGGGAERQTGGGAARQTGGGAARQTGGGAARQTGGGAVRQTGGPGRTCLRPLFSLDAICGEVAQEGPAEMSAVTLPLGASVLFCDRSEISLPTDMSNPMVQCSSWILIQDQPLRGEKGPTRSVCSWSKQEVREQEVVSVCLPGG